MTNTSLVPLSLFESVKINRTEEVERVAFDEIMDFLESSSEVEYRAKDAAPLFTSCEFESGKRRKANVLQSGLVILDVDDGARIDDAETVLTDLGAAGFIYTTASHRSEHHKFRVGLPLAANVDPNTYTTAWYAMNHLFGDIADPSKKGAESLFYFPGQYPGATGQFLRVDGGIEIAEAWIEAAGLPEAIDTDASILAATNNRHRKNFSRGSRYRGAEEVGELSVYNSRLVPEGAINAYLDTVHDWHHARFRFMCSVAGRAARIGVRLSPVDLLTIFNHLDQIDGGHFQGAKDQQALLVDADRALQFVGY